LTLSTCLLQVLGHFNVDFNRGLSADKVAEAQLRYGKNELAPEPGTFFNFLFHCFLKDALSPSSFSTTL